MKIHPWSPIILFLLILILCACQASPAAIQEVERSGPTIDLNISLPTDLGSQTHAVLPTSTTAWTLTPSPVYTPQLTPTGAGESSPTSIITTSTTTPAFSPIPSATIPPFTRTLKLTTPTMQGNDVLLLQQRLAEVGYTEVGIPDGDFGKKTDSAVRNYQSKAGLLADGIVGPITWQSLFNTALPTQASTQTIEPSITPDPNFTVLKYGDYSSAVGTLNDILLSLGYPICDTKHDFTLQTLSAVKSFQQMNGLQADGIVGQLTWSVLTSEKAIHASQSVLKPLQFRTPFRLEVTGDALAYEDTRLLVALGSQYRLLRIDPKRPTIIKSISMPNLGTGQDPFGGTHSIKFVIDDILVSGTTIWVGGGTAYGTYTREPAVIALESNGKLVGGPYKFGGWEDAAFLSFIQAGKEILAFYQSNSEGPSAWLLNSKTGITWKTELDISVMGAYNSTYDGINAWLSLPDEGQAVVWLNPTYGVVGSTLGSCGIDVAFDGTWLWVLQSNQAAAYDIATGEPQAIAPAPAGFTFWNIAARQGQVAVLGNQYGRPYLLILDH